jgi:hypothetical protein
MGSSSPPPAPPPVDYTPLFEEMKLQREEMATQQKAGQEAQRSALTTAQDTAAAQQAQQAGFSAQQALGRQQAYQQAMDFMSNEQAKKAAALAGQQATGGPINVAEASQAKLAAMGQNAANLPQTPANVAGMYQPQQQTNYSGLKSAPLSSFSLPNTSGLNFGGY